MWFLPDATVPGPCTCGVFWPRGEGRGEEGGSVGPL